MGSAVRACAGCSILAGAYVFLFYGLFATLISYSYTVTFSKTWFEDLSEYPLINLVFDCLPEVEGKQIFIVPPTERSVLTLPWAPEQPHTPFTDARLSDVPLTFFRSLEALGSPHVEAQIYHLAPNLAPVMEATRGAHSSILAPDTQQDTNQLPPWLANVGGSMVPFLPDSVMDAIICPLVRQVAEKHGLSAIQREHPKIKGRGVINELFDAANRGETSYGPTIAFSLFAIGVPTVKLLLCFFWFLGTAGDKMSWVALRTAAYLGRWAAVDCVAEALLVAMMIEGGVVAELNDGYTFFIGYIFLSAIALSVLDNYVDSGSAPSEQGESPSEQGEPLVSPGVDVPSGTRSQIVLAFFFFLLVLGVGATVFPLASLHVKESTVEAKVHDALLSMTGEGLDILEEYKPGATKSLVTSITKHLPKISAQTSLYVATQSLANCRTRAGLVGAFVLAAMVFIIPAFEACLSMYVVFCGKCLWLIDVIGDLHMLDVFVVGTFTGIVVIGAVGGLHAHCLIGLYTLGVAAVLYWTFQFFVSMHLQTHPSLCSTEPKCCTKPLSCDSEDGP
eukprot:TRINITY_DN40140_c0_g1_i1.p1 TRINITY_DN40140_c0_g1~~TRINITY_DN40140_c0_g1_i1.p1  ORF type:complete len:562 (-),score=60.30 TRINITY_DN40140_c0_g1_i1:388-2073(-)